MSTIIASNISDGTTSVASTYVVNGSAKAWVNFNGTSTVAIRDSENVSSLTDVATGDYRCNYSSNMSNQNYSFSVTSGGAGLLISSGRDDNSFNTTGYVQVGVRRPSTEAWTDNDFVGVTVHGDLA